VLIDSRRPASTMKDTCQRPSPYRSTCWKRGRETAPGRQGKNPGFYCGGLSCALSPKSAAIAVKLGFKDVRMYPEGEPGWKKLEYPTESSVSFVKTGNIVLVDLRSAEKARAGYIPRAVNIPAAILALPKSSSRVHRRPYRLLLGQQRGLERRSS